MIHFHADDSLKVRNGNITIQPKIASFVIEHLASYTLTTAKRAKNNCFSVSLFASQYAHMRSKNNNSPAHFLCACAWKDVIVMQ